MVHHQLHSFRFGIFVERLDVEVWIGRDEVENVFLPPVCPVLPSDVPTLDEHLLESVFGSEIDVLLHPFSVGSVSSVGLRLCVVGLSELHRGEFIGVVPRTFAYNHLPPYTAVLRGVYPTRVVQLARFVEIKDEIARQHRAGIVADHHRSPRRVEWCLNIGLVASGIGREPRLEGHRLVVEIEVHRRIVYQCRLVEVDVKSVVGLHLQCRLHTRFGEDADRRVAPVHSLVEARAYLGELRLLCLLLLRVVIAGNPPSRVVAGHGKLCVLFLYDEIIELLLLWKLIAQSHSFVIDPKADGHLPLAVRLVKVYCHLVVVIAYPARLSPYGIPCVIDGGPAGLQQLKSIHEISLLLAFRSMLVFGKFQSEIRIPDHFLLPKLHRIARPSVVNAERHHHISVG